MFMMAHLLVDATQAGEHAKISVRLLEGTGRSGVAYKLMQLTKAVAALTNKQSGDSLHFKLSGLTDDMEISADAIRRQLEEAVKV